MRDLDTVFARLVASAFRSRFRLAVRERDYMRAKDRETVLAHAHGFVAERLGLARPVSDGKQTPAPQPTATFPPWQGMQYMRDMFSGRGKLHPLDNDRYPGLRWTPVHEQLAARPASASRVGTR